MKKFFLIMSILGTGITWCVKPEIYLRGALNDGNLALAESIASNFDLDPIFKANSDIRVLISDHYDNGVNEFKEKVKERKSGGGGLSKEAVQAEVKKTLDEARVVVPQVNSKAEAKEQLVKFFGPEQVGGKLLTEVYGAKSPQKTIVDALAGAAPAA